MPNHFPGLAKSGARVIVASVAILVSLPMNSQQSPPIAGVQDANGQAAARKRKFEEEKQRLEMGDAASDEVPSDPDQTLFISPSKAGMVVGESRSFSVFDIGGKTLTGEAEWSVGNNSVVELAGAVNSTITAKSTGTVTVRARVGGRFAQAIVSVYPGVKFPPATVRWLAPRIPGFKLQKMHPLGTVMGGAAVCLVDSDGHGEILMRWLTSDGRQLFMKRGSELIRGNVSP